MESLPANEHELLERHERSWCRAQQFVDEVSWLPDGKAARRWTERIRGGDGDEEDWKFWLEHIAYLDPDEADVCLDWLKRERLDEPSEANHHPGEQRRIEGEHLDVLRLRADRGRHARQLAGLPPVERRQFEERLTEGMLENPRHRADERTLILAEALVDPRRAAKLVDVHWAAGYSDPRSECEVARRLWQCDPDAALAFIDRRMHCATLLPTILRRTLSEPTLQNRRLALEIIQRFPCLSSLIGRLALIYSLPLLASWRESDRVDLGEAMARAFVDLDPAGGYLIMQLRGRFTEAGRCHFSTTTAHLQPRSE